MNRWLSFEHDNYEVLLEQSCEDSEQIMKTRGVAFGQVLRAPMSSVGITRAWENLRPPRTGAEGEVWAKESGLWGICLP